MLRIVFLPLKLYLNACLEQLNCRDKQSIFCRTIYLDEDQNKQYSTEYAPFETSAGEGNDVRMWRNHVAAEIFQNVYWNTCLSVCCVSVRPLCKHIAEHSLINLQCYLLDSSSPLRIPSIYDNCCDHTIPAEESC